MINHKAEHTDPIYNLNKIQLIVVVFYLALESQNYIIARNKSYYKLYFNFSHLPI